MDILFKYRDKSHKGIPFPYHIVMHDNRKNWLPEYTDIVDARRNELTRMAYSNFGMPGKLWTYEQVFDNELKYVTVFMFKEAGHAAIFKLQL
ncbi:hypothetical protein D3C87_796170 [compost metagenome]